MSSPNQHVTPQSPPLSNEAPAKVVVPLPVIQQQDDIYYYVFVKGSLYASDTQVFGLEKKEVEALQKKFNSVCKQVENGVMFKNPIPMVVNALAELGMLIQKKIGLNIHYIYFRLQDCQFLWRN